MPVLTYVNTPRQSSPAGFSTGGLSSLLGNIQLGWDTSNRFAVSLRGLAIQRPDNSYVTWERESQRLMNVSLLTLPSAYPSAIRVPVTRVSQGDLIVASDYPFSVLYVVDEECSIDDEEGNEEFWEEGIECLDPISAEFITYCPPMNLFLNYFVKVVSVLEFMRGRGFARE